MICRRARQYAIITSRRQRRAIREHDLNMPVQDVCIEWALECRQQMVGCHHRDQIDREQGKRFKSAMSLKKSCSNPIMQVPSSTSSAEAPSDCT